MGLLPILGAIGKAAVPSLIGGLFGGSSKSQTTRTNFQELVDDAQAAGFNPLTALRATGGAGNVTTTMPSMSSSDFVRNALVDGVTAGLNYDPLARRRQELEVDILEAELANYGGQRQGFPEGAVGFPAPPSGGAQPTTGGTPPFLPMGHSTAALSFPDFSNASEEAKDEVAELSATERLKEEAIKRTYTKNPSKWPTGEHFETVWGDSPLSWVYSIARPGLVAGERFGGYLQDRRFGQAMADMTAAQHFPEDRDVKYTDHSGQAWRFDPAVDRWVKGPTSDEINAIINPSGQFGGTTFDLLEQRGN